METWVLGCAAQIGCLFGLSCLPVAPPFNLKIGLDIGRVFAKCLILDEFSTGLPSTYAFQFTM